MTKIVKKCAGAKSSAWQGVPHLPNQPPLRHQTIKWLSSTRQFSICLWWKWMWKDYWKQPIIANNTKSCQALEGVMEEQLMEPCVTEQFPESRPQSLSTHSSKLRCWGPYTWDQLPVYEIWLPPSWVGASWSTEAVGLSTTLGDGLQEGRGQSVGVRCSALRPMLRPRVCPCPALRLVKLEEHLLGYCHQLRDTVLNTKDMWARLVLDPGSTQSLEGGRNAPFSWQDWIWATFGSILFFDNPPPVVHACEAHITELHPLWSSIALPYIYLLLFEPFFVCLFAFLSFSKNYFVLDRNWQSSGWFALRNHSWCCLEGNMGCRDSPGSTSIVPTILSLQPNLIMF